MKILDNTVEKMPVVQILCITGEFYARNEHVRQWWVGMLI